MRAGDLLLLGIACAVIASGLSLLANFLIGLVA